MNESQLLSAPKNSEAFKRLDEFRHLIVNNFQLRETAKSFPQHAVRLINIVLEN